MATVTQLTSGTSSFLVAPRPGKGVCGDCFNLTRGFDRCYACAQSEKHLSVMAPISYSVGHEQLHRALWTYKRCSGPEADAARRMLAAVLWRFLARHEPCLAAAAGVPRFEIVTTVPSSDRRRDEHHFLRRLVGEVIRPTRVRHERLLRRTGEQVVARRFDSRRYEAVRDLNGTSVLLIDDTWTTGASAQSSAAALRIAGAGPVAAVVLGRHLNRGWHENHRHLEALGHRFDWSRCVLCSNEVSSDHASGAWSEAA